MADGDGVERDVRALQQRRKRASCQSSQHLGRVSLCDSNSAAGCTSAQRRTHKSRHDPLAHLAQGGEHGAGVRAHEAVVVEAEVGLELNQVLVKHLLSVRSGPEGSFLIASEALIRMTNCGAKTIRHGALAQRRGDGRDATARILSVGARLLGAEVGTECVAGEEDAAAAVEREHGVLCNKGRQAARRRQTGQACA